MLGKKKNAADDALIFFLIIPENKLLEAICMKCQSLFSVNIRNMYIFFGTVLCFILTVSYFFRWTVFFSFYP